MARANLDKWETAVIRRSQIKNAEYNPRTMDDKARKKLKANIEAMGIMGGMVWNKRTGNLVSGHQRLKIIDSSEKTGDYEITMTVVDLALEEEKRQNIFLNNPDGQGDFDFEKLEKVLTDIGGDPLTGFTATDQIQMFGRPVGMDTIERFEKAMDEANQVIGRFKQVAGEGSNKAYSGDDFYCILVFKNAADRERALENIGFENSKFFGGWDFIAAVKDIPEEKKDEQAGSTEIKPRKKANRSPKPSVD